MESFLDPAQLPLDSSLIIGIAFRRAAYRRGARL